MRCHFCMPIIDRRQKVKDHGRRLRALRLGFLLVGVVVVGKLAYMQLLQGGGLKNLAENQYSLSEELIPERGQILVKDHTDEVEYPVATAAPKALVWADPRKVTDPVGLGRDLSNILHLDGLQEYDNYMLMQELIAKGRITEAQEIEVIIRQDRATKAALEAAENGEEAPPPVPVPEPISLEALNAAPVLNAEGVLVEPVAPPPEPLEPITLDDNPTARLIARLSKNKDAYEPVARNVTDEQLSLIKVLDTEALDWLIEDARYYPEPGFGGQVLGFLSHSESGQASGHYGLEGYYDDFLSGRAGQLYSQTDASGRWIGIGKRDFKPAVDGGNLLLTIDRNLQVEVCSLLAEGVKQHDADSGSAVVIEPSTGRILAMCGSPDFDPGDYGNVEDLSVYNNQAIFTPYEPGSIFKPLVMAAAIDAGAVTPDTTFNDTGSVSIDSFTIHNSGDHVYGSNVSMIEVLDESINTGMVWVMRKMGRDPFEDYIHKFGFGEPTGVTLKTEVAGTLASLDKDAEVYAATASFGQGLTTTPIQIAAAYAALANGGTLMKPYLVEEMRYPDGTVETTSPEVVRQVVSPSTATTVGAMLVSVVENGHGYQAAVPGYYIAGKTGTAQIARNGVYSATDFNGSFAGFGPVEDPKFAMIVKIESPKGGIIYAESTAAPIFGKIAQFILDYYGVPPEREVE